MGTRGWDSGAAVAAQPNLGPKLHPQLRAIARNLPAFARRAGFTARVTSGYRSYATQKKLYLDYISGKNSYPAQPPGTSEHERGLALDIVSNNQNLLVSILTSIGLVWAGPNDDIHFQMGTGGLKSPQTAATLPKQSKKKKSVGKTILGAASWVPGPIGLVSTFLDFLF